jgi:hypothetical protein
MKFEVTWAVNFYFPWLEKIHDYVWPGDEEDE